MHYINILYFKLLLLVAVISTPQIMSSQITFQKVYPTTYDKTTKDIVATGDGYILAGVTNNSNITDCDLYVMKTDNNGNIVWEKTFGGTKPEYAYSMCETTDGKYLIVGYSQSFGGGDYDIYLVKIDGSGNKIWEKTYGGFGNDEGTGIVQTNDGNYVIVGTTSSNTSSQDAFLMKVDGTGTVLWTKYYGGSNKEFGNALKQCSDNGFIFTGQTLSYGQGGDTYLVRTNSSGDTLWTKYFSDPLADEGVSVVENGDGTFTFAVRDSTAAKDIDLKIMKTDASGNVVWTKTYGASQKDTPKTIASTSDGGYIVGAISRSFGWINPDMWLLKLNAAGDTTWSRHYGSSDHEHCHAAKQSADGGYLAIGHSSSYGPGQKIMFLKLNVTGNITVSVNESFPNNSVFNLFPNPVTDGIINLSFSTFEPCKIRICDVLGRNVYLENIEAITPDEIKIINLKSKLPGFYLLTIESQNSMVSGKFIIE